MWRERSPVRKKRQSSGRPPASRSMLRSQARSDQNAAGSHQGLPQKCKYCAGRATRFPERRNGCGTVAERRLPWTWRRGARYLSKLKQIESTCSAVQRSSSITEPDTGEPGSLRSTATRSKPMLSTTGSSCWRTRLARYRVCGGHRRSHRANRVLASLIAISAPRSSHQKADLATSQRSGQSPICRVSRSLTLTLPIVNASGPKLKAAQ